MKREEVSKSVLDIVDGNMTNEQIKDFTVLEEALHISLSDYIKKYGFF